MAKLLVSLPDEDYAEFKKKAKLLGLTTSAYVRTVIKDTEHRAKEHNEVMRAIGALVPTIAEAFGRTQQKDDKQHSFWFWVHVFPEVIRKPGYAG